MSAGLPWVGRATALEEIRASIQRMRRGLGHMVMVLGEPAVGKTTLVTKALEGESDLTVLTGDCSPQMAHISYHPWLEIIEDLKRQRLAEAEPLLPADSTSGDSPSVVASRLMAILTRVERPIVLQFRDIQWADQDTLEVLLQLRTRLVRSSVLIVATCVPRSHDASDGRGALVDELWVGCGKHVEVHRLTLADTEALMAHTLPAASMQETRDLALRLYEWTKGRPLPTRLVLETVMETGKLSEDPPLALRTWLKVYLRRLPSNCRKVVQSAAAIALINERFTYSLLLRVVELPEQEMSEGLAYARELSLVRPIRGSDDEYVFDHALLLEAACSEKQQLRPLHGRIADALISDGEPDADRIGRHLNLAQDPRAVEYLLPAAKQLHALNPTTAIGRYAQVLQLAVEDSPERAEALLLEGHALRQTDPGRAVQLWIKALDVANRCGDSLIFSWALYWLDWHSSGSVRGKSTSGDPREKELSKLFGFAKSNKANVDSVSFTERERQVLMLVALPNQEIADKMGIGRRTVESYLAGLYDKLDPQVRSRPELVLWAAKNGYTSDNE